MLWGVRVGLGPGDTEYSPELPSPVRIRGAQKCERRPVWNQVHHTWVCWAGTLMANAWAEVFIQGKCLNSTNDIIVLKCPNPVGEVSFLYSHLGLL